MDEDLKVSLWGGLPFAAFSIWKANDESPLSACLAIAVLVVPVLWASRKLTRAGVLAFFIGLGTALVGIVKWTFILAAGVVSVVLCGFIILAGGHWLFDGVSHTALLVVLIVFLFISLAAAEDDYQRRCRGH